MAVAQLNQPKHTALKSFLELYHDLQQHEEQPLEFTFSEEQQARFNDYYRDLLPEQLGLVGEDFIAFIFRLGLTTFRLAMMLTVLRHDEYVPRFDALSRVLVCNDQDFHTALTIADCLVSHTAYVYANLLPHDQKAQNPIVQQMLSQERNLYDQLPQEFTTQQYLETAKHLNIAAKTAERYIGRMVNGFRLVRRIKKGFYVKQ